MEYNDLINIGNKRSDKSKSTLKSAYNKKLKELDTVKGIINAYKEDLRALIRKIKNYNNWLFENDEFDTTFLRIGDGMAISLKK